MPCGKRVAVIPRSKNPAHVEANAAAVLSFSLDERDMATITALETLVDSAMSRPRNHRVDYFGVLGE